MQSSSPNPGFSSNSLYSEGSMNLTEGVSVQADIKSDSEQAAINREQLKTITIGEGSEKVTVEIEGEYLQNRLMMIGSSEAFGLTGFNPETINTLSDDQKESLLIGLTTVSSQDVKYLLDAINSEENEEFGRLFGKNKDIAESLKDRTFDSLTTDELNKLVKMLQPQSVDNSKKSRYTGSPVNKQIASGQIDTHVYEFRTPSERLNLALNKATEKVREFHLKLTSRHSIVKSYKGLAKVEEMKAPDDLTTPEEKQRFRTEQLAKGIAYRDSLTEGDLVKAPGSKEPPLYYKVAKKFGTNKGLVAYALEPFPAENKELQPMVLFRGTRTSAEGLDSLGTIRTDLDEELGRSGFESSKEEMKTFLKESKRFAENDIEVAGHSLGGTLAQLFVCEMLKAEPFGDKTLAQNTNSDKQIHLSTFNSPGLSEKTQKFAMVDLDRYSKPVLTIHAYRTEGDGLDKVGDMHLGNYSFLPNPPGGLNANDSTLFVYKPGASGKFEGGSGDQWNIDLHRSTFLDKGKNNGFTEEKMKFSEAQKELNHATRKRTGFVCKLLSKHEQGRRLMHFFKERVLRRGLGKTIGRPLVDRVKKYRGDQSKKYISDKPNISPMEYKARYTLS